MSLDISHRTSNTKVILLNMSQPFSKPLMVVSTIFLVNFVGSAESSINSIHAYASLEAAGCPLSHLPLQLHLLNHIFGAFEKGIKPINLFPGEH